MKKRGGRKPSLCVVRGVGKKERENVQLPVFKEGEGRPLRALRERRNKEQRGGGGGKNHFPLRFGGKEDAPVKGGGDNPILGGKIKRALRFAGRKGRFLRDEKRKATGG